MHYVWKRLKEHVYLSAVPLALVVSPHWGLLSNRRLYLTWHSHKNTVQLPLCSDQTGWTTYGNISDDLLPRSLSLPFLPRVLFSHCAIQQLWKISLLEASTLNYLLCPGSYVDWRWWLETSLFCSVVSSDFFQFFLFFFNCFFSSYLSMFMHLAIWEAQVGNLPCWQRGTIRTMRKKKT